MLNATMSLLEAAEAELIQQVYEDLRAVRDELLTYDADELADPWDEDAEPGADVRLRVQVTAPISDDDLEYSYSVLHGDPSYDQDHRGFWASSWIARDADDVALIGTARELVSDVLDAVAEGGAL